MNGRQGFTLVFRDNFGVLRTRLVQMRIRGCTFADLRAALSLHHLPLPDGVRVACPSESGLLCAGVASTVP